MQTSTQKRMSSGSSGSTESKIQRHTSNHCTRCDRGDHSREKCPTVTAFQGLLLLLREREVYSASKTTAFTQSLHLFQQVNINYKSIYRDAQAKDPICSQIMKYCRDGWPRRSQAMSDIHPYQQAQIKLIVAKI